MTRRMPPVYLALKMLHFLGLALGVGANFALFSLRRTSRDLEPSARAQFMLRAAVVSKNGSFGLLLMIVTGLGMFLMRGPSSVLAAGGAAFHAKLTLVVVLCGLLGYSQAVAKRARVAGGGPALATLGSLGNAMAVITIAIVVAAVLAFQ